MKIAAVLAALLGSAAAFAPTQRTARSSSALAAFENEIGAQPPAGFWDPLGMCDGIDQARFDRLRAVELKHGRISMLAIVGHMVTTAGTRWPGAIDKAGDQFADIPPGLAAFTHIPAAGIFQMVLFVGFLETRVMKDRAGTAESVGDFRNGMAGMNWNADDAEKRSKYSIELNNGRAAMMGILGLMVHEQLDGEPYMINAFLGYPSPFTAVVQKVAEEVDVDAVVDAVADAV